ncbi:hypothetical protein [Gillisia limnaea]|uniref:Membrane protein n=1 Tax=Gillisia limnaea (strain DSM 15749 / LMG 21470 / R-8282) TaxID=865937 RepID=H2BST7_GILLR|nr:hypothetical protein [Gillisia limnaea]EHQ03673.1 membrane protein [Gillisia limnaea DSM 15749]
MKRKFRFITAFICLMVLDIMAVFSTWFWVVNIIYIVFLFNAVWMFRKKYKNFNSNLYVFLGFSGLAFLARIFETTWYFNQGSLILLTVAYLALIIESVKHIEIKNASNYMLLYFTLIVGINAYLLGIHVFDMRVHLPSSLDYGIYIVYYINLLTLGVFGFIYYLNSYSKKAVFFVSLILALIFAEVLRDMGVFYLQDPSVEVTEGILRLAVALFAVLFFTTKEKKLRLINML